jgi:hypothetical protein
LLLIATVQAFLLLYFYATFLDLKVSNIEQKIESIMNLQRKLITDKNLLIHAWSVLRLQNAYFSRQNWLVYWSNNMKPYVFGNVNCNTV